MWRLAPLFFACGLTPSAGKDRCEVQSQCLDGFVCRSGTCVAPTVTQSEQSDALAQHDPLLGTWTRNENTITFTSDGVALIGSQARRYRREGTLLWLSTGPLDLAVAAAEPSSDAETIDTGASYVVDSARFAFGDGVFIRTSAKTWKTTSAVQVSLGGSTVTRSREETLVTLNDDGTASVGDRVGRFTHDGSQIRVALGADERVYEAVSADVLVDVRSLYRRAP